MQAVLGSVWVIYCLFHSLLANVRVKNFLLRKLAISAATYRVIYNVIALTSLVAVIYLHIKTASPQIFQPALITNILAALFIVAGLAIMLVCIGKYFKQLSGLFKESRQSTLQTGGLHQWVRHPLYLGTFIFLLGLVLYWPLFSNALAVFIIIAYTIAGTWLEEKKLLHEYGEEYRRYQSRVPMLLPRLFKTR